MISLHQVPQLSCGKEMATLNIMKFDVYSKTSENPVIKSCVYVVQPRISQMNLISFLSCCFQLIWLNIPQTII